MVSTEPHGATRDAIDGVVPKVVIEPGSAEEVAAILASAAQQRASVVIRGGGTRMEWGRPPSAIDILLCTPRLNAVVAHEYADLTATVQAGARLEDVNRELARHGQWLPIESPFSGATIGGAIASNDAGPMRHRYGTPRDLVIGVRLALTDGRIIKAGGNVVKNVAGYDLGKLVSGSFGTLAAIVSATFKLSPLPPASSTVLVSFANGTALAGALAALTGSQLEAAACEVDAGVNRPCRLLLKFESTRGALPAHVEKAQSLVGPAECQVVDPAMESDVWREHSRSVWKDGGTVVKASWMPAAIEAVIGFVDRARADGVEMNLIGRAAIGSGALRLDGGLAAQRAVIERMRSPSGPFRYVVLQRSVPELKRMVDVWGSLGDAAALGAAVKRALDPIGILNASRGPV